MVRAVLLGAVPGSFHIQRLPIPHTKCKVNVASAAIRTACIANAATWNANSPRK